MCGITGYWTDSSRQHSRLEDLVAGMTETLLHRGPDAGGTWLDAEQGVALGHRRLAILDLTDAGRQPMMSATERYVIVYNGEIYNHLQLRADLEQDGHGPAWRGHSDTETLLAAIEAWGLRDALRRISGMFAFGLWDRRERMLSLARDRLGEKPLHYTASGRHVAFASEIRALRVCPDIDITIDHEAAALFFRHGYIPAPKSIFRSIRKLPPGTFITAQPESFAEAAVEHYWSLDEVAGPNRTVSSASLDESVDALDGLLGRTVKAQMLSDAPLGTFLSGGLDSSLITALMAAGAHRKIQSFSIGFGESEFNEAVHARAVAQHLGTDHTEFVVTDRDALDVVPQLADIFDEPFADSSQIPTALLCRLARQRVTVALSGDGGDELFGGYNRYLFAPRLWDRFSALPIPLRHVLLGLAARAPVDPSRPTGRLLAAILAKAGLHETQLRKLSRYGDILSGSMRFDDVFGKLVEIWPASSAIVRPAGDAGGALDRDRAWPRHLGREDMMMAVDAVTYLPDDILVKVDRSAMAASLETRAPFLDRDVVQFAWSLPLHHKIEGGRGKQILRRVLDRYVPRALVERPKQGFAVPLDDWLRGPLRDWAEDLLSEASLADDGLLDPKPIRAAWREHCSGRGQFGARLWTVLMFQAWRQRDA